MKPQELDQFISQLQNLIQTQQGPTPLETDPFYERLTKISPSSDIQGRIRLLKTLIESEAKTNEMHRTAENSSAGFPKRRTGLKLNQPETQNTWLDITLKDVDILIRAGHDHPDDDLNPDQISTHASSPVTCVAKSLGQRLSKL